MRRGIAQSEWTKKVEQLEIAKSMAEDKARELEQRLEMILRSRSWKLTSPLRKVYDYASAAAENVKRRGWSPRYLFGRGHTNRSRDNVAVFERNDPVIMPEFNEKGPRESAAALQKSLIDSSLAVKLKQWV